MAQVIKSNGKRILIIGNGAIGTFIGWTLKGLGFECFYLGSSGFIEYQPSFSLAGNTYELDFHLLKKKDFPGIGAVFITVKAYDLEKVLGDHLAKFSRNVPIIAICNGAVSDILERHAKKNQNYLLRIGLASIGVTGSNGKYQLMSKEGGIIFGVLLGKDINQKKTAIEELICQGPFFCWSEDIEQDVREKWLKNTIINSLTAAYGLCQNGDLLNRLELIPPIFNEVYALGQDLWGGWKKEKEALYKGLIKLIEDTSENENSMHRDLRLGRRTESDYLAGVALRDETKFPILVELHRKISAQKSPGFQETRA